MTASNTAIKAHEAHAALEAAAPMPVSDSATGAAVAAPTPAASTAAAPTSAASAPATTAAAERDPRIARSRAALREAFITLVEERGIDGFSVGDLCTSAGLNRGTFYNHFRDKESLLASFEDEVIEGLGGVLAKFQNIKLRELAACSLTHRPLPMLVELYDYLREEGPFLHAMLGPGGDAVSACAFAKPCAGASCDRFCTSATRTTLQRSRATTSRFIPAPTWA